MNLEIKSLKGLEFKNGSVTCKITGGYGFYVNGKGYLSFEGLNENKGVKTPYTVSKSALQSVIDGGGLTNYDGIEWLKPTN